MSVDAQVANYLRSLGFSINGAMKHEDTSQSAGNPQDLVGH